jgi:dynein intermediate chain 1
MVDEGMPSEMSHETLLMSLRNSFNYSERTAQTATNAIKKRGISTEPPPQMSYSATVTQWDVYDCFMRDLEEEKKSEKEKEAEMPAGSGRQQDPMHSSEMK